MNQMLHLHSRTNLHALISFSCPPADEDMVLLGAVGHLMLREGTEMRCAEDRRLVVRGNPVAAGTQAIDNCAELVGVLTSTASFGCAQCSGNLVLPDGAAGWLAVDSDSALLTNWTECEVPDKCKPGSSSSTGGSWQSCIASPSASAWPTTLVPLLPPRPLRHSVAEHCRTLVLAVKLACVLRRH